MFSSSKAAGPSGRCRESLSFQAFEPNGSMGKLWLRLIAGSLLVAAGFLVGRLTDEPRREAMSPALRSEAAFGDSLELLRRNATVEVPAPGYGTYLSNDPHIASLRKLLDEWWYDNPEAAEIAQLRDSILAGWAVKNPIAAWNSVRDLEGDQGVRGREAVLREIGKTEPETAWRLAGECAKEHPAEAANSH